MRLVCKMTKGACHKRAQERRVQKQAFAFETTGFGDWRRGDLSRSPQGPYITKSEPPSIVAADGAYSWPLLQLSASPLLL